MICTTKYDFASNMVVNHAKNPLCIIVMTDDDIKKHGKQEGVVYNTNYAGVGTVPTYYYGFKWSHATGIRKGMQRKQWLQRHQRQRGGSNVFLSIWKGTEFHVDLSALSTKEAICATKDIFNALYVYFHNTSRRVIYYHAKRAVRERASKGSRWMHFAADLQNLPANELGPSEMVKRICKAAATYSKRLNIRIIDAKEMQKENLNMILAVGQGSRKLPKMLIMEYLGDAHNKTATALVGKGITFDSGGYHLKPFNGMTGMHHDMTGAATVAGAILYHANMGTRTNIIGLLPLAENMIGGAATRPGDVITARNGLRVEITSTDAEGRLVMGDALSYLDTYQSRFVFTGVYDIATLTGAVARLHPGVTMGYFTKEPDTSAIDEVGRESCEALMRIPYVPLAERRAASGKSPVANIANWDSSNDLYHSGHFLWCFVPENLRRRWAHFDIADVKTSIGLAYPAGFWMMVNLSGR
jgi:leucyl aminopeptidase